jgi:hypothetical protein
MNSEKIKREKFIYTKKLYEVGWEKQYLMSKEQN